MYSMKPYRPLTPNQAWLICIIFICLFFSMHHAQAQGKSPVMGNLLIDETVSFTGFEFYQGFIEEFTKSEDIQFSHLLIKESPKIGGQTEISIEYHFENIFISPMSAGDRYARERGIRAAIIAKNKMQNMQMDALFTKNPDLAHDEL